jgi:dTDP-4-dehydrorhamnose reductase
LSNVESIRNALVDREIAAIVNAGAYTAVDKAESDPVTTFTINAIGPAVLAEAARRLSVPLIHISTDYVFDGRKDGFYEATDAVCPLGVYGASKEAGEQAVQAIHSRSVILRTAWLVSPYGNNFLKTMLRLAGERPTIKVVGDQVGCPTVASDLADAISKILMRLMSDRDAPLGTFHFVNKGQATWDRLAEAVVARGARHGLARPSIEPISTAQYPTAARRPQNSRLSVESLTCAYGIEPRPWTEAVPQAVDIFLGGRKSAEGGG